MKFVALGSLTARTIHNDKPKSMRSRTSQKVISGVGEVEQS